MSRFFASLKEHKVTLLMLGFVFFFYGLLFFLAGRGQEPHSAVPAPEEASAVSSEALKAREALFLERIQERPQLLAGILLSFFTILFTGLGLNAFLAAKSFRKEPWIRAGAPHGPVNWSFRHVVQIFIFLFFVELLITLVELNGLLLFGWEYPNKDVTIMFNSLLRGLIVCGVILYLIRFRFKHPLSVIGLSARGWARHAARGLLGYVAVIPLLVLVLLGLAFLVQLLAYEPPPQPVVQMYLKEESTGNVLLFFTVFVAVLGPVFEEIFFRGFTYKALRHPLGFKKAAVITSLLFALLHFNVVAFIPIFILGLMLSYLYERTGSLVPSITAHMTHNLVMVGFTLSFRFLTV